MYRNASLAAARMTCGGEGRPPRPPTRGYDGMTGGPGHFYKGGLQGGWSHTRTWTPSRGGSQSGEAAPPHLPLVGFTPRPNAANANPHPNPTGSCQWYFLKPGLSGNLQPKTRKTSTTREARKAWKVAGKAWKAWMGAWKAWKAWKGAWKAWKASKVWKVLSLAKQRLSRR